MPMSVAWQPYDGVVFVDLARIRVRAGNGGSGSAHMLSEPYKPRGGPDGGDGGRGGDVVLRVDRSVFDLSAFRDQTRLAAPHGGPGRKNDRHGADGRDLVLLVPDGTVVRDERGPVGDLVGPDAVAVAARGGRGGRGNASLASGRDRAPRVAEPGEPGEEHVLELELRLVADVGLVGLPNAGKSTLLSRLTAARPKVADYPFTTLTPNLGVADGERRFVVADVPGLIDGAHQGRGLGLTFLRHVSRCLALVYVADLTGDPAADVAVVRAEVEAFDPELAKRRSLVVGTKADLAPGASGPVDLVVSGATGAGVDVLASRLGELVSEARAEEPERSPTVVVRPGRDPFTVVREAGGFRVTGPRVERWVKEAELEDPRQVLALQRRLIRAGVERRLVEQGARPGDEVRIAGQTFQYHPGPPGMEPDQGEPDGDEA
ncbi:MAG TPA: GTPase ObgE [Actinomycetota bacterium]|nr:GTPase ObgE [Actinomycetota bacterium]